MDKLATALDLARRGLRVFPLLPNSKRPSFEGWQDAATSDVETLTTWFSGRYADHNVGIATEGLLVLDADVKNGAPGLASLDLLEMLGAETSFTVATPSGGRHAYFRLPSMGDDARGVAGSVGSLPGYPGVDVRAAGNLVATVGSEIDGVPYRLLQGGELAECPAFIIDLARAAKRPREKKVDLKVNIDLDAEAAIKRAIDYLTNSAPDAIEGARGDETTYAVAAKIKDFGVSQQTALDLLLDHWNETKASPPWQPEDLEAKVANAYAYGTSPVGKLSAEAEFDAVNAPNEPNEPNEPPETIDRLTAGRITFDDLKTIPPRQWLYGKKVSRKYVTFVASPGGVGKTAFTYAIALACASNTKLLHDSPHKPLKVWMYNLEDDLIELKRRLKAALTHYDLPSSTLANLRLNSGRDRRFQIVRPTTTGTGFKVLPDFNLVIEEIKRERIDMLIVDPYLRSHAVAENENEAQDEVLRLYAQIAEATGAGIILVHHTKKGAVSGDIDSLRGGSAQGGGARAALTLSAMSPEEAAKLGVDERQRRLYVRVDDAKNNMAPPVDRAEWIKLVGVQLGNGDEDYPEGDNVQVATAWQVPEAMDGLTGAEIDDALRRLAEGPGDGELYSLRPQDRDRWAGTLLVDEFMRSPTQARDMLAKWLADGVIEVTTYRSPAQRKERKGVVPGTVVKPESA